MSVKYSPKFERDYLFYLNNRHVFNYPGCIIVRPNYDPEGVSAKEAFLRLDSNGLLLPCCQPDLFVELLTCKKAVNMQIMAWAEGYFDVMMPVDDLLESFIDPPEWIRASLLNQIEKMIAKQPLVSHEVYPGFIIKNSTELFNFIENFGRAKRLQKIDALQPVTIGTDTH